MEALYPIKGIRLRRYEEPLVEYIEALQGQKTIKIVICMEGFSEYPQPALLQQPRAHARA